jgi:carboxylesterase type B
MAAVVTDYSYVCPAYRGLVRAAQKGVPAWTYLFNYTPSCQWFSTLPQTAISFVGSTHTAEIPFVFGNLFDQPGGNGTCNGTVQEFTLSQIMIQAWTNMAATASPAGNGVQWPQWNASSSQGLNILNGTSVGLVNYTNCQL